LFSFLHKPAVWFTCGRVQLHTWSLKACYDWLPVGRIQSQPDAKIINRPGSMEMLARRVSSHAGCMKLAACIITEYETFFKSFLLYFLINRFNQQTGFIFVFVRFL
jgi:hypothetical protein